MTILQRAIKKSQDAKAANERDRNAIIDSSVLMCHVNDLVNRSDQINIDFNILQKKGFLNPFVPSISLSEQYRYLKQPLLANAFPESDNGIKNRNLLLITSSLSKEGKTYTALNLALSMAMEKSIKVLLIDGDVASPDIANILNITERPGLIEYLDGKILNINQILLRTNLPGLSVIPSGSTHRYSTELLSSHVMKQLAADLSTRYSDRIVIFDSPPVLAASQASVLATLVGQIVMVVKAETTPQTIVQDALQKIDNCDVIGMLLNQSVPGKGNGSYYYGSY